MAKPGNLTEKQEAFALAYFETGSAIGAYREAYDVDPNARDQWMYVEATQLLDNPKIALRLSELRERAEASAVYNREVAMRELEEARLAALKDGQAAAAVSATNSKAKLFGLDRPAKVELTGKDGGPVQTQDMTEAASKALAALGISQSG